MYAVYSLYESGRQCVPGANSVTSSYYLITYDHYSPERDFILSYDSFIVHSENPLFEELFVN